jgi:hypothetical protein
MQPERDEMSDGALGAATHLHLDLLVSIMCTVLAGQVAMQSVCGASHIREHPDRARCGRFR